MEDKVCAAKSVFLCLQEIDCMYIYVLYVSYVKVYGGALIMFAKRKNCLRILCILYNIPTQYMYDICITTQCVEDVPCGVSYTRKSMRSKQSF